MTPYKWFFSFLKKYQKQMLLGIFLTTVIAVLSTVNPYISGVIVDDVILSENYDLLPGLVACLLLVTLFTGALRFLYQVVFETASQGVLYDMRNRVYRKLLEEDFAFYNRKRTGDLMSRQTGDMEAIRHFVALVIYAVYQNVLLFIFALLMIFTVNTRLALCMLVVLPFTAYCTYRQSKEVKPAFQRNRNCFSSLNAFVQENISGNRVVKAFAREEYEKVREKYAAVDREVRRLEHTGTPPSPALTAMLEKRGEPPVKDGARLADLLRRPRLSYADLASFDPDRPDLPPAVVSEAEITIKYAGYIDRQLRQVEEVRRLEERPMPEDIDYLSIEGLRLEARQKLDKIRPLNLGQASRVSGVSPADVTALMIYLEKTV